MKYIFYLLTATLLAGCSTTPVSTKEAILIPDSKVLAAGKKFINQSSDSGQVIVKRDSGIFGSGCATLIYIDSKPVAELDTSEKVIFYVPEGEHFIGAEPTGICVGGLAEVVANVKKRSLLAFRYGIMGNGNSGIYPTAF